MKIALFVTALALIVACNNANKTEADSVICQAYINYADNNKIENTEKPQFEISINEAGLIIKKIDYRNSRKSPSINIYHYDENSNLNMIENFEEDRKISTQRFDKYGNQIEFVVNDGRKFKTIDKTFYTYDSTINKLTQLIISNAYSYDKLVRSDSSFYSFKYSNDNNIVQTYLNNGQLYSTKTTKYDSSKNIEEIIMSKSDGTISRLINKYDKTNRIIFTGESSSPKNDYNDSTWFSEYQEYKYDNRNLLVEVKTYRSNNFYSKIKFDYKYLHRLKTDKIPIESIKYFLNS